MQTDDTFGIPTGPVETRPEDFREFHEQAAVLRDTLQAAGVELGQYEQLIVDWLSRWEWATVAVIASWVARAVVSNEPKPGVTLPDRFEATPAEVDEHLRRILADEVYLRYRQTIRDAPEEKDTSAGTQPPAGESTPVARATDDTGGEDQ